MRRCLTDNHQSVDHGILFFCVSGKLNLAHAGYILLDECYGFEHVVNKKEEVFLHDYFSYTVTASARIRSFSCGRSAAYSTRSTRQPKRSARSSCRLKKSNGRPPAISTNKSTSLAAPDSFLAT